MKRENKKVLKKAGNKNGGYRAWLKTRHRVRKGMIR